VRSRPRLRAPAAHANQLQQQFTAAGVSAAYVDFRTTMEERQAILDRCAAGEVKVICNVATLTTGVD
jgi:DNA repair protein RadD